MKCVPARLLTEMLYMGEKNGNLQVCVLFADGRSIRVAALSQQMSMVLVDPEQIELRFALLMYIDTAFCS